MSKKKLILLVSALFLLQLLGTAGMVFLFLQHDKERTRQIATIQAIADQEREKNRELIEKQEKEAKARAALPPEAEVVELFTVTNTFNDSEKLDALKERFENLFIHQMYLERCSRSDESDFLKLSHALSNEISSLNAPGRLHYDILHAAKGSYQEVYAKTPCELEGIEQQTEQFKSYVEGVSKRRIE